MTTLRANVVVQNRDIGTQFGDLQFQPSRDRGLPMNDLPFEILSKIFIHCLPENPLSVLQPNCKIAPSLLCRVCTLWRDVASKTPQLWTDFHFSLPDTQDRRLLGPNHKRPPGLNLQFSKFFDGWTQNMGASPPSFHIRVFNNSGKFNRVGRYRSFEDLFASTSLRASRFLELTSLPLRMICDSQAPFQYLEALSLSGSGVGNNYNKSIFPPTPALRRISLGLDQVFVPSIVLG
ncbi:hypothetical protein B0H34DRAFT_281198 [Crassisporium funariophilum]|nr:hypothetical protein B0H34DRAFT_281198 [Crassisporium funariophilum]